MIPKQNKLLHIESLRALSLILVLLYHYYPKVFPYGFLGVDIFFCISGFVISLAVNRTRSNFKDCLTFFAKRVNRLLPTLNIVYIFSLIFGVFFLTKGEYLDLAKAIKEAIKFSLNYHFYSVFDYFDVSAIKKPILHFWSLSVEWQFYLTIPPLLIIFWRLFSKKITFFITLFTFFLSLCYGIYIYEIDKPLAFYSFASRLWEFLFGSLIYQILRFEIFSQIKNHKYFFNGRLTKVFLNQYTAIIIIIFGLLNYSNNHHYQLLFIIMIGTSIFLSDLRQSTFFSRFNLLIYIGSISYPVYVFHYLILSLVIVIDGFYFINYAIYSSIALSFILSILIFHFIENPIRKSSRVIFNASLNILISILIFAISSYSNKYLKKLDLLNTSMLDYEESLKWDAPMRGNDECRINLLSSTYCLIYDSEKPVTDLLIGDSIANSLYLGLSDNLSKKNRNLANIGYSGCAPFFNANSLLHPDADFNCRENGRQLFDKVLSMKNVETIFISFTNTSIFKDTSDIVLYNNEALIDKKIDRWVFAFNKTVDILINHGFKVVFITPYFELINQKPCIPERPFRIFSNPDKYNNGYKTISKNLNKRMINSNKEKKGFTFIETQLLLPENQCIDGNSLYRDPVHLSKFGSKYLSEKY